MTIKTLAQTGLASALLVLSACHKKETESRGAIGNPVAVQLSTISESEVPAIYVAAGTVRAKTTSSLSSNVMGTVRSINVRAGDRVTAGQVLVVLNSKDLDAQFESAEAAREGSLSLLTEADSEIASANANLELAEVTFGRMKQLYGQQSISNQEFDEASAKVKAARANYRMATAKRKQGESAIAQSEAAVRSADVNRSYSRITAPFSGLVTEKNVELGSLAVPGNPLLTIERQGSYRLEAAVDESRLSSIRVGEKVNVAVDGTPDQIGSVVSEIAPTVDPGTRSYIVKLDLPNNSFLRSGLFGRAHFPNGKSKAMMIPLDAMRVTGQLESVMVAEADVAHVRIITTGAKQNNSVTVLSGLDPGEKLIYPAQAGLVDGSAIKVRQ